MGMRTEFFVTVVLALLYCFQQASAGGTLNFLPLSSFSSLYGDDVFSEYISTQGAFSFGTGTVYGVYVSSNGFIAMGTLTDQTSSNIPNANNVVVPYGADIDPTQGGTVRYTQFGSTSTHTNTVSLFIQSQITRYFYGSRMMIVEWYGVPKYGESDSTTVTFQAVLITDGSDSYAVFIYDCGGMGWGGATIGWQDSATLYREHYLSGSSSADVGCLYSNSNSAIVYKLNSNCDYNEFTCDNGDCQPLGYKCDGYDDCGDYSDEDNCDGYCQSNEFQCDNGACIPQTYTCDGYDDCGDYSDEHSSQCDYNQNCLSYEYECDNGLCTHEDYVCDGDNDCEDYSDEQQNCSDESSDVGLEVGLSVASVFIFLLFFLLPICLIVGVYCVSKREQRSVQSRVVETSASGSGGTAVVTSTQANETSFTDVAVPYLTQPPLPQPAITQYPPQHQQSVYHKDAHLSVQVPPPSYESATAFASYVPQGYPQYQSNPVVAYPPQQTAPYPTHIQAHPEHPVIAQYPNHAYPTQNHPSAPQLEDSS